MADGTRRQVRLNSQQLRTLAHPLRARLLAALRGEGPATATELAQRLETNSGATSYHLRQLAEVGLVEEDRRGGRGGPRWWRSAHESTTWTESDFDSDPDDRAAADWSLGHHVRVMNRWVEEWLAGRREWSKPWRDAAGMSDLEFHLTPDQLDALMGELHQVIERHRQASDPTAAEAERCVIILQAFPAKELPV
ncbi:MAG: winged helix-turn-helix domain-containing protein [Actinomycetes bacterium]